MGFQNKSHVTYMTQEQEKPETAAPKHTNQTF